MYFINSYFDRLGTVYEKTKVRITELSPELYLDGLVIPMMMMVGDEDEMIKFAEVKTVFDGAKANVKRLRLVRGGHSKERDAHVISQISKFCSMIFKLNPIDHLSTLHI